MQTERPKAKPRTFIIENLMFLEMLLNAIFR